MPTLMTFQVDFETFNVQTILYYPDEESEEQLLNKQECYQLTNLLIDQHYTLWHEDDLTLLEAP